MSKGIAISQAEYIKALRVDYAGIFGCTAGRDLMKVSGDYLIALAAYRPEHV